MEHDLYVARRPNYPTVDLAGAAVITHKAKSLVGHAMRFRFRHKRQRGQLGRAATSPRSSGFGLWVGRDQGRLGVAHVIGRTERLASAYLFA